MELVTNEGVVVAAAFPVLALIADMIVAAADGPADTVLIADVMTDGHTEIALLADMTAVAAGGTNADVVVVAANGMIADVHVVAADGRRMETELTGGKIDVLGRCKTAGLGATDIGVDASTEVEVIGP